MKETNETTEPVYSPYIDVGNMTPEQKIAFGKKLIQEGILERKGQDKYRNKTKRK